MLKIQEAVKRVQAGEESQSVLETLLSKGSSINTVEDALKILSQEDYDIQEYNEARSFIIAVNGEAENEIVELLDDLELVASADEITTIIDKIRVLSPLQDMMDDFSTF